METLAPAEEKEDNGNGSSGGECESVKEISQGIQQESLELNVDVNTESEDQFQKSGGGNEKEDMGSLETTEVAYAEAQDLKKSEEELIPEDEKKISALDEKLPHPEPEVEVVTAPIASEQAGEMNAKRTDVVPDIKELTIKNLDTGEQYVIGENDPDFEFDTFPLTGDMGDGTVEGNFS
jgi:hypothetical protein